MLKVSPAFCWASLQFDDCNELFKIDCFNRVDKSDRERQGHILDVKIYLSIINTIIQKKVCLIKDKISPKLSMNV